MKKMISWLLLLALSTPAFAGNGIEGWSWNPIKKLIDVMLRGGAILQVDAVDEGFFTPQIRPQTGAFSGLSYLAASTGGYFRKQGRQVYITGQVTITANAIGTGTGRLELFGLPYGGVTSELTGQYSAPISVTFSQFALGSTSLYWNGSIANGATFILFNGTNDAAAVSTLQATAAVGGSFNKVLFFNGTYLTDRQ